MDISIIIPVYNEEETLPILHKAIHDVMDREKYSWEAILVDDGSTDKSVSVLRELTKNDENFTIVEFRRNFGQTAAIAAGIDNSIGDTIILMDADMQNDPIDIPRLMEKLDEGYDVVSGWRKNRKDDIIRRFPSRIANTIIANTTGVKLNDFGCTLKAYKREVITEFRLYGEMHRFIPAWANSIGAKIAEIPVTHHPRKFGQAKYGIGRTGKVVLDLLTVKFLTGFAGKPIYLFGGVGLMLMGISILIVLALAIIRLVHFHDPEMHIVRSPLLPIATALLVMGFQCILMGLLSEQMARTYHESQNKVAYKIRNIYKSSNNK